MFVIVDLNKDTKTTINKVPTGSSPDLSQVQFTKIYYQCLRVNIPVYSVTGVFIEVCRKLHLKYDKTSKVYKYYTHIKPIALIKNKLITLQQDQVAFECSL